MKQQTEVIDSISFQVPFFLFIIFTVYTMLPFQLWYAVVLSVISSLSHIMVLTVRLTIYSDAHTPYLANQVKLDTYDSILLLECECVISLMKL